MWRRGNIAMVPGDFPQAVRGSFRYDFSAVQHKNLLTQFSFIHIRCADKDGNAFFRHQLLQDGPQLATGQWVDAYGRLVQQQEPGRTDQGAGQPQFLFHATG